MNAIKWNFYVPLEASEKYDFFSEIFDLQRSQKKKT